MLRQLVPISLSRVFYQEQIVCRTQSTTTWCTTQPRLSWKTVKHRLFLWSRLYAELRQQPALNTFQFICLWRIINVRCSYVIQNKVILNKRRSDVHIGRSEMDRTLYSERNKQPLPGGTAMDNGRETESGSPNNNVAENR